MKLIFIFVILISGATINEINSLKTEAMEDFDRGSFDLAEKKLTYLKDSLGVNEAQVVLNLASSQYLQGKAEEAFKNYKSVAGSKDPKYSSQALQQMGVISYETEKYPEALEAFKQSLIRDPKNLESRYNYELVKKKLKEQPQDQQDKQKKDKDKDQEKKEDREKDKDQKKDKDMKDGDKDNEKKEEEKSDQKSEGEEDEQESEQEKDSGQEEDQDKEDPEEKEEEKGNEKEDQKANPQNNQPNFEEMKISPEVAKMILQAMENREMQYFQQLKKEATKSNNKKSKW